MSIRDSQRERFDDSTKRMEILLKAVRNKERDRCLEAVEDEPLVPDACSHFNKEDKETIKTAIWVAKQNIRKRIKEGAGK